MAEDKDLTGPQASQALRERLTGALRRVLTISEAAVKEVHDREVAALAKAELAKVTPPDVSEKTAHKIKAEYPGDKAKAYATMWSIHDKLRNAKKSESLEKTSAGMNISRAIRLTNAEKAKAAPAPKETPAPAPKAEPMAKTSAGMNISRAIRLTNAEKAKAAPKPAAVPQKAAKNEELGYGGDAGAGADQSTAPMAKKTTAEGLELAGAAIPPPTPAHAKPPGASPKLPGMTKPAGHSRPGGYKLPGMKSKPSVPVHTSARHANSEIGAMSSIAKNPVALAGVGKSELCKSCTKPMHLGKCE